MRRIVLGVVLLAISCHLSIGCGGGIANIGPKRFPISGNVTLDGKPLKNGTIKFISAPGISPAIYSGGAISNGAFQLNQQTGLPAGKYLVTISSAPPPAAPSTDPDAAMAAANTPTKNMELIPKKYNEQTVLTLDVVDGTNHSVTYDLKTSK